ncbi:MAG: glycosyltransferase [Prevotella sp.]|nr:glycosyltransferase [Prevotella sp.]
MEQVGNKISVITVVYNDVAHIRETMKSYFSQTWENKEYIVIDGGSTDGTADIIKEYTDRLAYWCSEPDGGIYDAMNKGISHASGDWINILNSGDTFVDKRVLEHCMELSCNVDADVIYGNSREIHKGKSRHIEAYANPSIMDLVPVYRHGSSLVRAKVHKANKFDLSKHEQLGYALDWEQIHRLYKQGCRFCKLDLEIQSFQKEGISDNTIRSFWYNYQITSEGRFNLRKFIYFIRITTTSLIKGLFS